jgi:hypothetical protein
MFPPVAIRIFALLLVGIAVASAEPIKATAELTYLTNPPKPVNPQPTPIALTLNPPAAQGSEISPSDIFLQSYKLLQQADQVLKEKDTDKAKVLLQTGVIKLIKLKLSKPDWEPTTVDHLLDSLRKRLAGLK